MEEVLFIHPYLCMIVWTIVFIVVWCFATHRFWRFKKKHPEVFRSGRADESKEQSFSVDKKRFLPVENPLYQTVSEKSDEPDKELQKECLRRQYNNNLSTSQFIIMVWGLGMFVPLVAEKFRWFVMFYFIPVVCIYIVDRLRK